MADQTAFVQGRTGVGALLQENFAKGIVKWFGLQDPLAALFRKASGSKYKLSGKKLVITAESQFAGGAMATSGWLPAHQEVAPITLETTPARRYVRSAVDNFIAALTKGPGAAEDYMARLNRQHLERFEEMERRHTHGSSTGTVCTVSSRTSATVIVVKDGYGYVGQPPLAHLRKGMWVTSLDASNSFAVLKAAVISSINFTTNTITFATAIDDGTTVVVAGDPLVFSTTPTTTETWFETERGKAPLGVLDIADPKAANSSYLGVVEADEPLVKPLRRTSTSFDDMEFKRFVLELESKSTSPVTPDTHTMSTQGGIVVALAEALTAAGNAQFVQEKGKTLMGGWKTVKVAGHDFIESPYHIFDTIFAWPMEDLHRVHLGPEFEDEDSDGSVYSRLPNYDGREWYGKDYMQMFADRRNRIGALTAIPNTNATRYTNTPT